MRLDQISLRLRPRGAYEATDLGVRLLQRNAGSVYGAWLAIVVPIMLVVVSLQSIEPWVPALALWWLKPLYDRVVLFVLSRKVFGQAVQVSDVTSAWRIWMGSGLIGALTWRRLAFTRAFTLPVYLLERLTGKARRQRIKVLQKNGRTEAGWTQIAYLHTDAALSIGMIGLVVMLLPQYANLPVWSWIIGQDVPAPWTTMTLLTYIIAVSIVEPLYVAAGFALYLNRRVELEAWDIEISLRRAAQALTSTTTATTATAAFAGGQA